MGLHLIQTRVRLAGLVFAFSAFLVPVSSFGQTQAPYNSASSGDYGGVGLLATRTARFHDDGVLEVGTTHVNPYNRLYLTFQVTPWLESTFRYTEITNRDYSIGGLESDNNFLDRGADIKLRLLKESRFVPQVAIGLQDGLGTGIFSGEYLVLNKRFYDFDFSLGMGWGLLGSRGEIKNPLINLSDVFSSRGGGSGGQVNLAKMFTGPTVGLFGGVEWQTPVKGLSVKLEYDGNSYLSDPLRNNLRPASPFNIGVNYRPADWIEFSGAFERGNTAMFRASLRSNLTGNGIPKTDPPPAELKVRPRPKPIERSNATDMLLNKGRQHANVKFTPRLYKVGAGAAGDYKDRESRWVAKVENRLQRSIPSVFDAHDRRRGKSTEINRRPVKRRAAVLQLTDAALDRRRIAPRSREGAKDYQQASIVDHLFDGLEASGFVIDSIDLSHEQVTLHLQSGPDEQDGGERQASQLVFQSLPVPVKRVVFVRHEDGKESRVAMRRSDIRRTSRIDEMFDGLEDQGFAVESLEVSRRVATVYLTPDKPAGEEDFAGAARLVAGLTPEPLDSVVVVGLSAGVEMTRVSLRRITDSVSGTETDELVPDLSDNEKREIALRVFVDLEKSDFDVEAFRITRRKATAFVVPKKYRQYARNVGRAARIVANNAPPPVEEIEIVTMNGGLETGRVTIMRRDLEDAVMAKGSPEEIWGKAIVKGPQGELEPWSGGNDGIIRNNRRYPNFSWRIRPALRQHVGGPDAPYLFQIWLATSANVELYRGLSVNGTLGKNIYSDLQEITLGSDSQLPKVRSDIKNYLQEGEDGNIVRLQLDYQFQPFPDLFARVSAGLLEEMFAGVNAEVLYRPFGSRLAIGADIARVRQRDFDQRFTFRDYEVTTGHLNLYYKLPWYGLQAETHTGQFLAGDRGTQFVISRAFDSGMTLGAWATFTNVSAEEFGEGSFDKGFYVTIPFDLFLTSSTRRRGTFAFRPLTRDGGQILAGSKRLYGLVDEGNLDIISRNWRDLLQ